MMAGSIDALESEVMQLPPDQRLTLACRILSSLEPVVSLEIDTIMNLGKADWVSDFVMN